MMKNKNIPRVKRKLSNEAMGVFPLVLTGMLGADLANAALEEVVVTAQKREQNLQDVGIAVTALDANAMNNLGITSSEDIQNSVAGMQSYSYTGKGAPQYFVRGVGTADFAQNTPPTTPIYVDEVYVGSSVVSSITLFDLAGAEVLKGPQGTLFGRNTVGGAVSYHSRRPTEEFDGYVNVGGGSFETYTVEGAVGGPLSDNVRYRVAAKYEDQNEGHYDNVGVAGYSSILSDLSSAEFFNGETEDEGGQGQALGLRGTLAIDVTDSLSALVSASYGEYDGKVQPLNSAGFGGANCPLATDLQNGAYDPSQCSSFGFFDPINDFEASNSWIGPQEMEGVSIMANLEWDLDSVTITSITSWSDGEQFIGTDVDASPERLFEKTRDYAVEAFTQEFRIQDAGSDEFFWVGGVYFSDDTNKLVDDSTSSEDVGLTNFFDPAFAGTTVNGTFVIADQETTTWAAFLHTEWQLLDEFKLTAGARYTDVNKNMFNATNFLYSDENAAAIAAINPNALNGTVPNAALADVNGTGPGFIDTTGRYNRFSGKVGLDWNVADQSLIYLSYSRGFREGGFEGNLVLAGSVAVPYDSETLDSTELGWKTQLFDDTIRFNGAVYHYDYADVQQRTTTLDANGVPANFIANVGDNEQYGLDVDIAWLPTDRLTINASLSWLDQEITVSPTQQAVIDASPDTAALVRTGDVFPYASEISYTLLGRYEFPIFESLMLALQGDLKYSSDYFTTAENVRAFEQDAYTLYNARITLADTNGKWEAALWGKNLGDEAYITQTYAFFQNFVVGFNKPRTWGLSVTFNF